MIPDVLIANYKFLNGLSDEERAVFEKAAQISTDTEIEEWAKDVETAKKTAEEDMGVTFIEPDLNAFKDKVKDVQQEMLDANPDIRDLYDHIQEYNEKYAGEEK